MTTTLIKKLRTILEEYANDDSYWIETRNIIGDYISNGATEESFNCTDNDSNRAQAGLDLLDEIEEEIK